MYIKTQLLFIVTTNIDSKLYKYEHMYDFFQEFDFLQDPHQVVPSYLLVPLPVVPLLWV